jgi:hypothetical protein
LPNPELRQKEHLPPVIHLVPKTSKLSFHNFKTAKTHLKNHFLTKKVENIRQVFATFAQKITLINRVDNEKKNTIKLGRSLYFRMFSKKIGKKRNFYMFRV